MTAAEEFEQARQKLGLTREAMAETLGITRQGLWLILTDQRLPSRPLRKLLDRLVKEHDETPAPGVRRKEKP